MPHIFQDQKMLQSVTLTNQQYASKYNLRKEKIQIHPDIEHNLVLGANNDNAINSIANFMRVIIRRIKIKNGLTDNDRIQLFMHTKKKPIKTQANTWLKYTENEEIRVKNLALRRDFIQQNSSS